LQPEERACSSHLFAPCRPTSSVAARPLMATVDGLNRPLGRARPVGLLGPARPGLGDEGRAPLPRAPPGWMTSRWCRPERAPKARPRRQEQINAAAPADPSATDSAAGWFASNSAGARHQTAARRPPPARHPPGAAARASSTSHSEQGLQLLQWRRFSAAAQLREWRVWLVRSAPAGAHSPKRPGQGFGIENGWPHRERPSRAGAHNSRSELVA